jgi:hypothetical protein
MPDPPTDRFDGDELGGLQIELTPGDVDLRLPGGRMFTDVGDEIDRADREARRADDEAQRANRLAEALRSAGIDPDSV